MSTIPSVSSLTEGELAIAFSAVIKAGLQEAYDPNDADERSFYNHLYYNKIARCTMPTDWARKMPDVFTPEGGLISPLLVGRLPRTDIIAQLMPQAKLEALSFSGGGATAYPLLREAQTINLGPYEAKEFVSKWEFLSDIHGTVANWIRMLRRGAEKNADILLSKLLNNGNTASCWHTGKTGKNFFDTNIAADLAGPVSMSGEVFDNYFTGTPLTAANVLRRISYAKTIKLGDGLPGGVLLDTLIVPPELEYDAEIATMMQYIVYGGTNAAPGQPAATAAMGENVVKLLKHVKQVVVADMLTSREADGSGAGPAATWYLMDSRRFSLGYSRALGPQYAWQVAPNDTIVFEENRYTAKVNTWEGAGYLLPQYIAKCVGV